MIDLGDIAGGIEPGTLYGIGVGPGDVRYLTLRAAALIGAVDVLVSFSKAGSDSHARRTASALIAKGRTEISLGYPVTTEAPTEALQYRRAIAAFYDEAAGRIAGELASGRTVGVLAEGDPFFYSSFMHLWRRLSGRFPVEVVPGITGMSGAWTRAGRPITWGDDVLSVVPGTLEEAALARRLAATDAAVVMKIGRNLPKVRRAIVSAGLIERALLVEHATMPGERVRRLADVEDEAAPYFAIVIVPGRGRQL